MKIEFNEMIPGQIYRVIVGSIAGEDPFLVDFVEFVEFGSWETRNKRKLDFAVVRSDHVDRPHILEAWRIRSVHAYDN